MRTMGRNNKRTNIRRRNGAERSISEIVEVSFRTRGHPLHIPGNGTPTIYITYNSSLQHYRRARGWKTVPTKIFPILWCRIDLYSWSTRPSLVALSRRPNKTPFMGFPHIWILTSGCKQMPFMGFPYPWILIKQNALKGFPHTWILTTVTWRCMLSSSSVGSFPFLSVSSLVAFLTWFRKSWTCTGNLMTRLCVRHTHVHTPFWAFEGKSAKSDLFVSNLEKIRRIYWPIGLNMRKSDWPMSSLYD